MAAARRALACACAAMACVAVEGAKAASSGRQLKSVYTTIVNRHISEIMTLFLSDTLNFEWSSRLVSQRPVPTSALLCTVTVTVPLGPPLLARWVRRHESFCHV